VCAEDFLLFLLLFFRGPYSVLRRCIHKESRKHLAVKIVELRRLISTRSPSIAGKSVLCWALILFLVHARLRNESLFCL